MASSSLRILSMSLLNSIVREQKNSKKRQNLRRDARPKKIDTVVKNAINDIFNFSLITFVKFICSVRFTV